MNFHYLFFSTQNYSEWKRGQIYIKRNVAGLKKKEKNPVLIEFLEKEKEQLTGIIQGLEKKPGERAITRRRELEKKLCLIQETQRMTEGEL